LSYFSVFASDSVPSDISTGVDNDPWSAIDALTSLHVPMRSSLKTYQDVVMRRNQYSWSQQDAKAKDQLFSEELSPNWCLLKTQKAKTNLLSSLWKYT